VSRIRKIEIWNFRAICRFSWAPSAGINCLIGPGDSGKSTVLDAIDYCLGARRNLNVADTDFFNLDVTQEIVIRVTLGALPDALKNLEYYGPYLRGFGGDSGEVEDEPRRGIETALTVQLAVKSDLEPVWSLYSERTLGEDPPRALRWKDRVALAPARLGQHSNANLSWTKGSVLNRLSDERADVGLELVKAAREARAGFGAQAAPQLANTLKTVTDTAKGLGIPVGAAATALLDAHAVSFGDGAISLHNEAGIPLRNLGTGSSRLLIAGLHRAAAALARIVLVDEIEYGLEPHRLTRLLNSLGSKEQVPPLQAFITTHSPVTLRELSGTQLYVLRNDDGVHHAWLVGSDNDVQGAIRSYPEAFLARTIIVCEGASEVGLIRGLDDFWVSQGSRSLQSAGVSYVDAGGGDADTCFYIAKTFQKLGYRVAVLQDNDKPPKAELLDEFRKTGGYYATWREGKAVEDELFASVPDEAVTALIARALELTEDGKVDAHIRTRSEGKLTLNQVQFEGMIAGYTDETRIALGAASRIRKAGWFKSISKMEGVARDIIGPYWTDADAGFTVILSGLYLWACNA
jgi:putative ATP-dependent endonuclease of OLD family